ncbi:MAG: 8-amino-7-oxononanoate synthase [Candidatus Auribacterota bacterium]
MSDMRDALNDELNAFRAKHLYRSVRDVNPPAGNHVFINSKECVNFASNNYLGLAQDTRIISAAKDAMDKYGVGAGASRLISGSGILHAQIEARLAVFKKQDAALVFPTGFMANLGIITSLMDSEHDLILADRLIHASLFDACSSAKALFKIYPHNDTEALQRLLCRYTDKRRVLIVTDGVFSMDGDIAPIHELGTIAAEHNAWLMVDDAHGTGVLGINGVGSAEECGAHDLVTIHMGTFSKACGVMGGFVAGPQELRELLINKARSFIYTTGIPPALCAACITALDIIRDEPWRRVRLRDLSKYVRNHLRGLGFTVPDGITPVIPVILHDNELVMNYSRIMMALGVFAPGIRYPTVPRGQERLRVSLQAVHTDDDIEYLLSAMEKCAKRYGTGIITSSE